jgi:hypothetical protein
VTEGGAGSRWPKSGGGEESKAVTATAKLGGWARGALCRICRVTRGRPLVEGQEQRQLPGHLASAGSASRVVRPHGSTPMGTHDFGKLPVVWYPPQFQLLLRTVRRTGKRRVEVRRLLSEVHSSGVLTRGW